MTTTEIPTLFDALAATKARDEALERVEKNADPVWKQNCVAAIKHLAEHMTEFNSDHVWQHLHEQGAEMPHEGRALGALFKNACKSGIITATDKWVQSERPACHRRPVRVWRSQIFPN